MRLHKEMQWNGYTFRKLQRSFTTRCICLLFCLIGAIGYLIKTHTSSSSYSFGFCVPKNNIVFLKPHKCAGSSIQNILMRYGDVHNLTFVLPTVNNYMGHPAPFNRTMVATPRLSMYNILAHHTRFNYNEMQALMPINSIYITIVRDPVKVFQSVYHYYDLGEMYGGNLHQFVAEVPKLTKEYMYKRKWGMFGSNQMMFDLGANPTIFTNETSVIQYINKLDSWFDLVLIADKMDESLVLLKHFMCWDLDDVVAFKLNSPFRGLKINLSEKEKTVLMEFNYADILLYNYFSEKFEKIIDAFGRKEMAAEIEQLKKRTQEWYDTCVKGELQHSRPTANPKYYVLEKIMVFQANTDRNSTCKSLRTEELSYTDILRQKQKSRFNLV